MLEYTTYKHVKMHKKESKSRIKCLINSFKHLVIRSCPFFWFIVKDLSISNKVAKIEYPLMKLNDITIHLSADVMSKPKDSIGFD